MSSHLSCSTQFENLINTFPTRTEARTKQTLIKSQINIMKVILYMAHTINGIIARNNYDEDFLSHENWKVFLSLVQDIGCFVVGRKTYEEVKKWKDYNFDKIKATKIIISSNPDFKPDGGYILATSPTDAIQKASKLGFKKILLTGGGTINSAFMKKGLVDEIIIDIEPFILGNGIRIFSQENFESKLKLLKVKKLKSGIVQLHYKVKK